MSESESLRDDRKMMREATLGLLVLMTLFAALVFTIYAKASGLFSARPPAAEDNPITLFNINSEGEIEAQASLTPRLVELPDNETNKLVNLDGMQRISPNKLLGRPDTETEPAVSVVSAGGVTSSGGLGVVGLSEVESARNRIKGAGGGPAELASTPPSDSQAVRVADAASLSGARLDRNSPDGGLTRQSGTLEKNPNASAGLSLPTLNAIPDRGEISQPSANSLATPLPDNPPNGLLAEPPPLAATEVETPPEQNFYQGLTLPDLGQTQRPVQGVLPNADADVAQQPSELTEAGSALPETLPATLPPTQTPSTGTPSTQTPSTFPKFPPPPAGNSEDFGDEVSIKSERAAGMPSPLADRNLSDAQALQIEVQVDDSVRESQVANVAGGGDSPGQGLVQPAAAELAAVEEQANFAERTEFTSDELKSALRDVTLGPNQSLLQVTADLYQDPRWAKALWKLNRKRATSSGQFVPGSKILYLPKPMLRFLYPELAPPDQDGHPSSHNNTNSLVPSQNPAPQDPTTGESQGLIYQTKGRESLFDIAAEQLDQASRYTELYELNRATLDQQNPGAIFNHATPLPKGLRLQLPPR